MDYSTFQDNVNVERFYTTVHAKPMYPRTKGIVSVRGTTYGKEKELNAAETTSSVDPVSNTFIGIYDLESVVGKYMAGELDWDSTVSYGLFYYELGE